MSAEGRREEDHFRLGGGGGDGATSCLAPRCRRREWPRVPPLAGIRLESVEIFRLSAACTDYGRSILTSTINFLFIVPIIASFPRKVLLFLPFAMIFTLSPILFLSSGISVLLLPLL